MFIFPPTVILRHRRENLKKCSLRGLEQRADFHFYTYPKDQLPNLSEYVLLTLNAPLLSKNDKEKGIFLIDATWRYASVMQKKLPSRYQERSLPREFLTAYPRRQEDCPDPERGLASIEALYISYVLMDRNTDGLLDNYYWKDEFLIKNFQSYSTCIHWSELISRFRRL